MSSKQPPTQTHPPLGRGTPLPTPSRRLRQLDPRAYGARLDARAPLALALGARPQRLDHRRLHSPFLATSSGSDHTPFEGDLSHPYDGT